MSKKKVSDFIYQKRYERIKIIFSIYKNELLQLNQETKNFILDKELSEKDIEIIIIIFKNYLKIKKLISFFIPKGWTWDSTAYLLRAILIYGCYEMMQNNSKIVINEMIIITKIYCPDDSYKFINKILDSIYVYGIKKLI